MIRLTALPLTLAALVALSACGTVAPEAPALLARDEIIARSAGAADSSRGETAARGLAYRGAALRARAAALRRTGIASGERVDLLRRADELKRDAR